MAMRRLGVDKLLRLLILAGAGDRGRAPLTGSKTVEAWRMTRVARTLSSVRSNWSSLYTEEMKPRATKSLLQNISNDSLTPQGRHSANRVKNKVDELVDKNSISIVN
jgi:acetyl esterase/lipase